MTICLKKYKLLVAFMSKPQERSFCQLLEKRQISSNSVLCVGLDPDCQHKNFPVSIKRKFANDSAAAKLAFNKQIIESTHPYVCAYKLNSAFYENDGERGVKTLKKTIALINKTDPTIATINDAKKGDIGNTNRGYAEAIFDDLKFDAVTISPYLGSSFLDDLGRARLDSMLPFLERKNKGIIVLAKTSNKDGGEFQDLPIDLTQLPRSYKKKYGNLKELREIVGKNIVPLYQIVAYRVSRYWNANKNCGLVVGATYPLELKEIRKIIGEDMFILIPGFGAQGGKVKDLACGYNSSGRGVIVNSSRGIIFKSSSSDFAKKAAKAAQDSRDAFNKYRIKKQQPLKGLTPEQKQLADLLISTKIMGPVKRRRQLSDGTYEFYDVERKTALFSLAQAGEFAFKHHEANPSAPLAPDKIMLRRLPQSVLDQVGKVLAEVPLAEKPDACAGLPNAGVALAKAYSKFSGIPFLDIFEKIVTKEKRRIVIKKKNIQKGKKILIIDDVVTKAFSVLEGFAALKAADFKTLGLLVVDDREQGGAKRLAENKYPFYSAFKHSQLLDYYLKTGKISKEQHKKSKAYISLSSR